MNAPHSTLTPTPRLVRESLHTHHTHGRPPA